MTSYIRIVNVAFGETAQVSLNNQPAFTLQYQQASDYIAVPAGTQSIFANLTGNFTSFLQDFFVTEPCRDYTVLIYASSDEDYRIVVYPDDNSCCKTPRFRFINTINQRVNLLADGYTIFLNVDLFETGNPTYLPVKTDAFTFRVVNSAELFPLTPEFTVQFQKKTIYTLILLPTAAAENQYEVLVLATPCRKH
jgi:hypothetical protein